MKTGRVRLLSVVQQSLAIMQTQPPNTKTSDLTAVGAQQEPAPPYLPPVAAAGRTCQECSDAGQIRAWYHWLEFKTPPPGSCFTWGLTMLTCLPGVELNALQSVPPASTQGCRASEGLAVPPAGSPGLPAQATPHAFLPANRSPPGLGEEACVYTTACRLPSPPVPAGALVPPGSLSPSGNYSSGQLSSLF